MTAGALRCRDLGYRVAGRWVLDGLSLDAEPGELLGVFGPAGAGKTSLLHVVAGLITPDRGDVLLGDQPPRIGATCALIPQVFGLSPVLTAAENVALPLAALGIPTAEVARRTDEALQRLRLTAAAAHLAGELSGGQQQRVAVARALASDRPLLLADEPTAELDAENRAIVLELLRGHASAGGIVLVTTHDPEVEDVADRALVLTAGTHAA